MPSLACPNSSPLAELAGAIRARSRALKHKFSSIEMKSSYDDSFDPPVEAYHIVLRERISFKSTTIRLTYWDDRWVWIDARAGSKKGWIWSFTDQGRLKGGNSGGDLLRFVEQFHQMLPSAAATFDYETASSFWDKLLMKGPRAIQ